MHPPTNDLPHLEFCLKHCHVLWHNDGRRRRRRRLQRFHLPPHDRQCGPKPLVLDLDVLKRRKELVLIQGPAASALLSWAIGGVWGVDRESQPGETKAMVKRLTSIAPPIPLLKLGGTCRPETPLPPPLRHSSADPFLASFLGKANGWTREGSERRARRDPRSAIERSLAKNPSTPEPRSELKTNYSRHM